jgi:hypothetical protein
MFSFKKAYFKHTDDSNIRGSALIYLITLLRATHPQQK